MRMLGAGAVDLSGLPTALVRMLARYGNPAKAQALRLLAEPRRTATLVATWRHWRLTPSTTRWICSIC